MVNAIDMPLDDWFRGGKYFAYKTHPLFYRESTSHDYDAAPLLLIHGFPTAGYDWRLLWHALCHDFHLIVPDMIGFGFSAKPRRYAYSIMDQADLIEALMERLGISACHVMAHDYGDTVAQELLARSNRRVEAGEPQGLRLRSIIFLNGGLFPEAHRPLPTQKLLASPLGSLVAARMNERRLATAMQRIFGPETLPSQVEVSKMWRLIDHNGGPRIIPALIGYMAERKANRGRWVGAMTNPAAPPLRAIVGAADPISGAHMAARYRTLVPQADVVELARIGHYPQIEAPAAILEAFVAFHRPLREPSQAPARAPDPVVESAAV